MEIIKQILERASQLHPAKKEIKLVELAPVERAILEFLQEQDRINRMPPLTNRET